MKFQVSKSTCGPVALGNALLALGITRGEEELVSLCRQTALKGTPPRNLLRAVRSMATEGETETNLTVPGLDPYELRDTQPARAVYTLLHKLSEGRPSVALVDGGAHYVAVVGRLGTDRVCAVDSAGNELWHSYTIAEWTERWDCGGAVPFWALVI